MANQPSSRKWIIEPIVTEEAIISIDDQVAARLARLSIVLADIGGTIGVVAGSSHEELWIQGGFIRAEWNY